MPGEHAPRSIKAPAATAILAKFIGFFLLDHELSASRAAAAHGMTDVFANKKPPKEKRFWESSQLWRLD
jgi:hypothetical protein